MANLRERRRENVAGDFYVDTSCIDCDTCRWMAPETFAAVGDQAAVQRQPANEAETRRSLQALVACPTASIGTRSKHPVREIAASFPIPVGAPEAGVFHCGFHDEASFGAASYLIRRPAATGGNVLVDAPRFAKPLVRRLEELGGVATLFLTHRDDVGDHARFRAHFGCERVLHAADATGDLRRLERLIEGTEAVRARPIHEPPAATTDLVAAARLLSLGRPRRPTRSPAGSSVAKSRIDNDLRRFARSLMNRSG